MPRVRRYPPEDDPPQPQSGILFLIQPDPYVWLYAVDVPSTPPTKYRVTAYPEPVQFERDSLGAVITYSPASVVHEDVQADTEGSIQTIKLRAQNLTREGLAILENYNGLIGQAVRIVCIKLSDAPDGDPVVDEVYDVLESGATEAEVEFTLGRSALTQRKFPDRRLTRSYCVHRYGGAGCGYDTKRGGALQTCTKLLLGTNGCIAHGLNEAAAGLPNRHPARMLVFRGIPRASGTGVS